MGLQLSCKNFFFSFNATSLKVRGTAWCLILGLKAVDVQGLKMAQPVTDAQPDLGHIDKLPSSIAFSAKTFSMRWEKLCLLTSSKLAVRSNICKDVCDSL